MDEKFVGGVEWLCIIWTLEESDVRKDLGLVEKRANSVPNLYIDKGSFFFLPRDEYVCSFVP